MTTKPQQSPDNMAQDQKRFEGSMKTNEKGERERVQDELINKICEAIRQNPEDPEKEVKKIIENQRHALEKAGIFEPKHYAELVREILEAVKTRTEKYKSESELAKLRQELLGSKGKG